MSPFKIMSIALALSVSTAQAAGPLAIRIDQTFSNNLKFTIHSGIERGKVLVHHRQTVLCEDPVTIEQRLEFARAKKAIGEIAVYETALSDIAQGKVTAAGQCESYTHRYGIVDLTHSAGGYRLFVQTPSGSYIAPLHYPPDQPASYTLIMEDGNRYKKGISSSGSHDTNTLSYLPDNLQGNFNQQLTASSH